MDPVSAIGLVGSVVGIVDVITKSVAYLSGLQSSYKIVDLKVRLLVGQLSTLKAALDQVVDLINAKPDIPRDKKLVNDLSVALACVEAVIFAVDERLSDLQRTQNQDLKILSKVGFIWDEQTINDYLSLLNNQVNALNLFLTALQCRTTVEQTKAVGRPECQSLLRLVRDDTSSLLWLRDSDSIGTCKSVGPQDLGTINATFGFDTEVFASKAYRTATRSSMLCALLSDVLPDGQKGPVSGRRRGGPRSLPSLFSEELHEEHPGKRNAELEKLCSLKSPPNYTTYPMEALQRLPRGPARLTASSLSNTWQQRAERLFTKSDLARTPSPDLGAISESQEPNLAVKVLVLGTSESGKSTLIKSLKVGYMGGYSEEERQNYKPTILKNLWEAMRLVGEIVGTRGRMVATSISQQSLLLAWEFLGASTERDIFCHHPVNMPIASGLYLRTEMSAAIQTIWKEAQSRENSDKLTWRSSADKHFANSSDRILNQNYTPTDEDILYCRSKTTGIYETRLVHGGTAYHFFDLGCTNAEQKNWIRTLGNANAVIFTCDVSCYDAVLNEDDTLNGISQQLDLFESIANSEWSTNSQIIVLFTKEDTLTPGKLLTSPFQAIFPHYDGNPEIIEDAVDSLVARFRRREMNGRSNVVFCRSGGLASSTTRMGELVMNALPKARRGAVSY